MTPEDAAARRPQWKDVKRYYLAWALIALNLRASGSTNESEYARRFIEAAHD